MMKRFINIALVLLVSACSLPTRAPISAASWTVAPERTAPARQARTDLWLKVGTVAVAPPYDGKSLVYRLGDQRYEKDFYNIYSSIPSEMIGNAERRWMNNANIFAAAVGQSNSFFPYYTLQLTVNEFYGDYRVRPEAVVSVEFFLSTINAGKSNPLIGANRYSKRVPLKDNTPEALVLGQQQALAEIFKEYEEQLYKYAGNLPKPIGQ
jgi:cholesterol transport system auxiliary component